MVSVDNHVSPSGSFISGATGDWEVVIGMEVHAQLSVRSKLFSGASVDFGAAPNTQVSFFDAAMPGMLPILNSDCVRQAVMTGLSFNAHINQYSVFARKNYFYPDLPQGYQISQHNEPIVGEGKVSVSLGPDKSGQFRTIEVGIERIHLEQDAGKSIHDQYASVSCIDLNRSGIALMEIVTNPDMRSSLEAKAFLTKLRTILRYLGTCDGNMEEGSMRADVNISVCRPGDSFGTRCEVKNVNSIRFLGQAIEYEARRQIAILEDGGHIIQETRLFDHSKNETRSLRTKEDAHDYRYFADPDLLPLEIDEDFIREIKKQLPELPDAKRERFITEFGISLYDASVLVSDKSIADYFEKLAVNRDKKIAANWVINDLLGGLNKSAKNIEDTPISPDQLGELIDLIIDGTISGKIAKDIFNILWEKGGHPKQIVDDLGLRQVTNISAIELAVDEVINSNPSNVARVAIKPNLVGWFVGQVMKNTGGKANPGIVQKIVKDKLGIK
ncbi:aspartyl/glutamyl-tRNA amidotransferase subunit B [Candidatus Liberibacter solanacearum CLso-ZC1]|uniref:Aspartyl/glutamyl-tRNA(Asn/Gln) amidotransferase subunit B n=1 Tax=Liberibacter solanacearum (strain CLso-ZC1) TaxID=658172 RepID=E4UB41_LIBSC|nr:Asp-tRNA(Asn)/Glu-tRNA(Gln) amidotransferase subunit GatB [Candidatus Liberibacter solanacearum]ADR52520.1 aspartyl/glutamyl-tRNA amidotransferase subunit B [Candidatus Liberibacter solanacearum CLso-ZC1]